MSIALRRAATIPMEGTLRPFFHPWGRDSAVTEPAVTLTDYGLTLLCWFFAWRARAGVREGLRPWAIGLFAGSGAAALFGGTVHGFFGDTATLGHRILWPATILSVGATGLAAWGLGARVGGISAAGRRLTRIAAPPSSHGAPWCSRAARHS
ncbi:DUF6962 family protein [Candidatus Palauibacter sp.]|uniref:DUF6962 family protein n=1 Tax=Candidatus Palauibacter sp. TaxID=3101350 RepID=UPI003B01DAB0